MFYALLGTLLIVVVMAGAALSLFFRRGGDRDRTIPAHPDAQGASR